MPFGIANMSYNERPRSVRRRRSSGQYLNAEGDVKRIFSEAGYVLQMDSGASADRCKPKSCRHIPCLVPTQAPRGQCFWPPGYTCDVTKNRSL